MTLNIGVDAEGRKLELPDNCVTETLAMLAKRGMGKSNAAVVLAEEMHRIGAQWVAIDPKGDWWGIRSSADGKGPGLPIPVFGGRHGDLPLEATAGALMARLVIERDLTAVLDVSKFSKAEQTRFVTDFAETLFTLIGDSPRAMHLFLEEAEEYLPQRVDSKSARMVGAYSKISKQGRTLGLGVTLVTQRSASLNKDALSQTDTLILFRTVSPHDRKAVVAWADYHTEQLEIAGTLAQLQPGESWILSPGFLGRIERVTWRRRNTFDSGATPITGAKRLASPTLADLDVDELQGLMADTIERVKADDPKELRRRIAELERQVAADGVELEAALAATPPPAEPVEVPVIDDDTALQLDHLADVIAGLTEQLARLRSPGVTSLESHSPVVAPPSASQSGPSAEEPKREPPPARRPAASPPSGGGALGKAERDILVVLAQFPGGRSKAQIALLTGRSIKSSGLSNALGALRSAGLITKPPAGTPTEITAAGIDTIGDDYEPLPTGRALLDHWLSQLGLAEREILEVFVDRYPNPLTKQEVADATGRSVTSSGLSNALGRLRSLELVNGWLASDDLMESIR